MVVGCGCGCRRGAGCAASTWLISAVALVGAELVLLVRVELDLARASRLAAGLSMPLLLLLVCRLLLLACRVYQACARLPAGRILVNAHREGPGGCVAGLLLPLAAQHGAAGPVARADRHLFGRARSSASVKRVRGIVGYLRLLLGLARASLSWSLSLRSGARVGPFPLLAQRRALRRNQSQMSPICRAGVAGAPLVDLGWPPLLLMLLAGRRSIIVADTIIAVTVAPQR